MINKLQKWVVVCSCVRAINIRSGGVKLALARAGRVSEGWERRPPLPRYEWPGTRDPGPREGAADCGEEGPDIRIGSII